MRTCDDSYATATPDRRRRNLQHGTRTPHSTRRIALTRRPTDRRGASWCRNRRPSTSDTSVVVRRLCANSEFTFPVTYGARTTLKPTAPRFVTDPYDWGCAPILLPLSVVCFSSAENSDTDIPHLFKFVEGF